ncbi:MAG: hypothetical protein R3C32_11940 [Chloroflexota bacterium]
MRQRLVNAAVLVPVVLVVFLAGQPWLTWASPPSRPRAAGRRRAC